MMDGLEIRLHPTLDILCREDGAILTGVSYGRWKPHWTYGWDNGQGYRQVEVDHKSYKVHRLIAEAFHPNPKSKPEVDHIDRDRSNNCASNLCWADDTDQQRNRFATDATVSAFGVRARDDKKAWSAAYKKAVKKARAEGVQWVAPMFRKSG
jgi:hypothetical protein